MKALLAELRRQVALEDCTEEEDRLWVERSGAWLGLLLLDALGGTGVSRRDESVRVLLGEHGSFDTFGAMQAALESDDPSAEFVRQVDLGEAEATGRGPVSRVVSVFVERLAELRPNLRLEGRHDLDLLLSEGVEVDLSRVQRSTEGEPLTAVRLAVDKFISMLPGGDGEGDTSVSWDEAKARIMPRIVGAHFVEELGEERASLLQLSQLCADTFIALQLEYQGRSRFLRVAEFAGWGVDAATALQAALHNLARRSQSACFARAETGDGTLVIGQSRDGWDSSRLLLPGLYDVLSGDLRGPFAVAIPHRDELLACSAIDIDAVSALRDRARDDALRAPHRISDAVFLLGEDGLEPFEAPADLHH